MNNLSNLRYLKSSNLNFSGIGKLRFLQQVNGFNIKNKNGYRIEELEHMNELRSLKIYDLENVRYSEEACKAKLCNKRNLIHLSLFWGEERDNANRDLDERVLDNLPPHNYLKTLNMKYYMGVRSAIWMNEAHLINNLQEMRLYSCLEWEILPPFGQLPFLKTLWLWNLPKVKRIENKFHGNDMCSVFPSLKNLYFQGIEALVDWFDASIVGGLFPCLTTLCLADCPNLQELPYLPPKLQILDINNIGWKNLNCCRSVLLETLGVRRCENITSISLAGEIGKLKDLTLYNLPSLKSIPSSSTVTNLTLLREHRYMQSLSQL